MSRTSCPKFPLTSRSDVKISLLMLNVGWLDQIKKTFSKHICSVFISAASDWKLWSPKATDSAESIVLDNWNINSYFTQISHLTYKNFYGKPLWLSQRRKTAFWSIFLGVSLAMPRGFIINVGPVWWKDEVISWELKLLSFISHCINWVIDWTDQRGQTKLCR